MPLDKPSRKKIRLDQLLVDQGFAETQKQAQAVIISGAVKIDQSVATKPGMQVAQAAEVTILENQSPYVSRGGLKLAGALTQFRIKLQDKIAVDIGASTGGFTDCLLQKGVKKVYAIDVGYGQFASKLRNHPQVVLWEKTNVRYLTLEKLSPPGSGTDLLLGFDVAVIDVSFISLTKIIPVVIPLLKETGEIVALIKPQFEIPKSAIRNPQLIKGGVVRDQKLQEAVVQDIVTFSTALGLQVVDTAASVLPGPAGNQEYFIYLRKQKKNDSNDSV